MESEVIYVIYGQINGWVENWFKNSVVYGLNGEIREYVLKIYSVPRNEYLSIMKVKHNMTFNTEFIA